MTECRPSTESVIVASELSTALAQLGLTQYEERLQVNGFEDWESATAITETDMEELGFKLGDHRRLQRAIREHNDISSTNNSELTPPQTAYVLFGEHVRQDPGLGRSSFTDLAKETGKRWGYKEEVELYKQSENYQDYQTYLEEFKQGRHKTHSTMPPGPEEPETTNQENFGMEDLGPIGQSQPTTFSVKSGMAEVRHISEAVSVNPHLSRAAAFPQELTTQAVESFLRGTGSLLYFWDRDEALGLVKNMYHPDRDTTPVDVTEVLAMSAVGSYCDGEGHSMLLQKEFLASLLYMLSSPSDICDFRRMRLFTCLAICRFTDSVESTRRLLLSALSIGRQTFTSPSSAENPEEVRYWWNVFQSVVFLESWFAYNTNHESRVTSQDLNALVSSRLLILRRYAILQVRMLNTSLEFFMNALLNLVS
ncbi:HMG box protein [Paraphaeosphaeria sporulosa]